MIHRITIAICLLLALAIVVVGALSYRMEIVCWGGDVWTGPSPSQLSQLAPGNAVTGSRASFENGSFVHLWTSLPRKSPASHARIGVGVPYR